MRPPTTRPPKNTMKNVVTPSSTVPAVNAPDLTTMSVRIAASTMEVASLNRLSPSTRMVKRSGTPSFLKSDTTETGSVALRMAPRSKAEEKGMVASRREVRNQTIPPMTNVDARSPGTARVKTGPRLWPRCRASRLKADSNMSVGRKTNRIKPGEISNSAIPGRRWG